MNRPELLRYHPNRFSASRDYFRTLYNDYRSGVRTDGVWSMQEYQEIYGKFASTYWNLHLAGVPIDERPRNTKRMCEEFDMFVHVAQFFHGGRNIFHFSRSLVELLKLTDVEDVLWDSIKLPYPCFYVWFGPQENWHFRSAGHIVDGAYVAELLSEDARIIEFMVTTKSSKTRGPEDWDYVTNDDPYYYFSFELRSPLSEKHSRRPSKRVTTSTYPGVGPKSPQRPSNWLQAMERA